LLTKVDADFLLKERLDRQCFSLTGESKLLLSPAQYKGKNSPEKKGLVDEEPRRSE
jgi:hypothetical protein